MVGFPKNLSITELSVSTKASIIFPNLFWSIVNRFKAFILKTSVNRSLDRIELTPKQLQKLINFYKFIVLVSEEILSKVLPIGNG